MATSGPFFRIAGRLAAAAIPPGVVAAALLAVAAALRPEAAPRAPSPEVTIVETQRAHASASQEADIVLVGDSSCLMGVDAVALGHALGVRVANLCTFGLAGPEGYAALLRLTGTGAPSRRVIVVMHPASLQRSPGWEHWVAYSRGELPRASSASDQARGAFRSLVDPIVPRALPGAFARRYGGESRLATAVMQEGVVDPTDRQREAHLLVPPFIVPGRGCEQPAAAPRLVPNEAFVAAAGALRDALAASGRDALFAMAPSPCWSARPQDLEDLARIFGIPRGGILAVAGTLPPPVFATPAHLLPAGRALYTAQLADALRGAAQR